MFEFFVAWVVISCTNVNAFFSNPAFWGWIVPFATFLTFVAVASMDLEIFERRHVTKMIKAYCVVLVVAFIGTTVIPSKTDAAYIFGIGMGLKAMNNEHVARIPENAAKLINKYLEEVIEDQNIIEKPSPNQAK